MCFNKMSQRRMFFVHCPFCGTLQDKSEREKNEKICPKCSAKLRVSLIPGLLLIKFDNKKMQSPEYDGKPEHDRRSGDRVFFL